MRESVIEKYLIKQVKQIGGTTRKLKYIGRKDATDRLVLLPDYHAFVELKAPGETSRISQSIEHKKLRASACEVFEIDTFEGVDNFIDKYLNAKKVHS